ncbi:unnamed protein product, partial [Schistosoma curassoni]|uniref:Cyclic nucleotide-binding domain-containing protein n=1 Tax=Schistosoma curassoni TaxID=6186 RepID=A0A183KP60_9TREM
VFYETGEYIIREGELGETFFIIKSGKVRVTHTIDRTDETKEIRQLSDGDWFGERALYTCEKRSANVISAEGGVHLLSLDRSNFIYLIGDLNEFKSKTYDDINRPSTGHRSNHEHALPSIQKDLGRETSADGLERRTPRQDSKERRSEQM